ncbi:MAG: hypothetical protein NTX79_00990 [Candidatus Micrarchaeota archaeon]|nr:hypothetical protein [Candidatus Micrarchaeota archaeon]
MQMKLFGRNLLLALVFLAAGLWLGWKPFDILFVWWLELVLFGVVSFLKTIWIMVGGTVWTSPLVRRSKGIRKIGAALLVLLIIGFLMSGLLLMLYLLPYEVVSVLSFQAMTSLTGTPIQGVAAYMQGFSMDTLQEIVGYAMSKLDLAYVIFAIAFLILSLKDATGAWHLLEDPKEGANATGQHDNVQKMQDLIYFQLWWASLEKFAIFGLIMMLGVELGAGNLFLTLALLVVFRAASDTFLAGTSIYEIALKTLRKRT